MALFIVPTPIGNLGDLTFRAVKVLKEVDFILAEDKRVSATLLRHIECETPLLSYHDFNKEKITPQLIERLKDGQSLALISDAGTPGISDPGFYLVRAAIDQGIAPVALPGPNAAITALSASGLPTDQFTFVGFLPPKSARRRKFLQQFSDAHQTLIIYESPYRVVKTIADIASVFGDCKLVIGRELTKKFEEYLRDSPQNLLEYFTRTKPRGEFVLLLNPRIRLT